MSFEVPSALAITFYSVSTILQWFRVKGREIPKFYVQLLTLGGVIAQCLSVYHAIHIPAGINLNFFSTGSLSAGMVVLIVLVSSLRKPVENLLLGLLPLAIAAIATNMLFSATSVILTNHSAGLVAHILFSILSYSMMTVAAFQALLLSYQEKHLKDHLPIGIIKAFPPMQTMEKLLFEFLWAGLILLTVALGTGFMYLQDMFAQHVAHKTILGVLAWCLFVILLAGRAFLGWRGRTAIRWTLSGFFMLMLAYFGSRFIIDLVLN